MFCQEDTARRPRPNFVAPEQFCWAIREGHWLAAKVWKSHGVNPQERPGLKSKNHGRGSGLWPAEIPLRRGPSESWNSRSKKHKRQLGQQTTSAPEHAAALVLIREGEGVPPHGAETLALTLPKCAQVISSLGANRRSGSGQRQQGASTKLTNSRIRQQPHPGFVLLKATDPRVGTPHTN